MPSEKPKSDTSRAKEQPRPSSSKNKAAATSDTNTAKKEHHAAAGTKASTKSRSENHGHIFERKKNPDDEFKCSGCGRESSGERYRCTSHCDKVFHKECKAFKETGDREHKHKHKYELRSYKKVFKCDGCKQEGFGKRFRCDQCGHELHTLCKFPQKGDGVNSLTQLPFKFHEKQRKRKGNLICGACTNNIDGYFYHCAGYVTSPGTEDGLYLHPCCFNLSHVLFAKLNLRENGTSPTNENELKYTLSEEVDYGIKCFLCKHWRLRRPHPGLSYVCNKKDVCCRVYCVWEVVREASIAANGHEVNDMSKALVSGASKQLGKSSSNSSSSSSFDGLIGKILMIILKMVASTLMGDPTFGIVHLYGLFINN